MSRTIVPLPESVSKLASRNTHPGLALDKFPESATIDGGPPGKWSEHVQRPTLERVAGLSREPRRGVPRRWPELLGSLGPTFVGATVGPLTLHLSRASALENAGVSLHPVYGFAYLPGTGLKGLARAFAETVWKEAASDPAAADADIRAVFGSAGKANASAGAVVFHDAWPAEWPRLFVDVVNNHHPQYYQAGEPPGDWENPIPVYFLAVEPATRFVFAVHARRADADPRLVELATDWLKGGLTELGAGAKTSAGYGTFTVTDEPPGPGVPPADGGQSAEPPAWTEVVRQRKRADERVTLELVSPAFLAGAGQQAADCDLRAATLRGQLRWWWRVMHAGHMPVGVLRPMEAAVWGDTTAGGAVRLTVRPVGEVRPVKYDRPAVIARNKLPRPANNKTSQGLIYFSYGMDEVKDRERVTRHYLPPGAKWEVRLTARGLAGSGRPIPAADVLEQARTALGMLCRFGGVGAKCRKGFGGFADLPAFDPAAAIVSAQGFRLQWGFLTPFGPGDWPLSDDLTAEFPLPVGWRNPWVAIDLIASAAQKFAQDLKHQPRKKALGLPRNVRATNARERFTAGRHVGDRHASPVWYHLGRTADGRGVVRVVGLPAEELPNRTASRTLLAELIAHLRDTIPHWLASPASITTGMKLPSDPGPPGFGNRSVPDVPKPTAPDVPKPNARVEVVIAADPKNKGRVFATHPPSGLTGPVVNGPDVPAEQRAVGNGLVLVVNSVNPADRQIAFRYPKP